MSGPTRYPSGAPDLGSTALSAGRPLTGALVRGLTAAALVPVLDERLAVLQRLAAAGRIDVGDLGEVRETFAAIRQAGRAYVDWVASGGGSAEAVPAETRRGSMGEVSTERAAEVLAVTPRRVRQLCAAGLLTGRKVSGVWVVDSISVESYKGVRSHAA